MKCPGCNDPISSFTTKMAESRGTGDSPLSIRLFVITCPNCSAVLGTTITPSDMMALAKNY